MPACRAWRGRLWIAFVGRTNESTAFAGSAQALFFGTREEPCPYLPDRMESRVVADLRLADARSLYDELAPAGFRRSHGFAYRPACNGCRACVPVRIPVARFRPSRSQHRSWRRNGDLETRIVAPKATPEHQALFARYQRLRHPGGAMAAMSPADFRAMVEETPVATRLVEARDGGARLVAASLTDRLGDGLSAVYTFYEPALAARSLGTWLILWHVARARALGLRHVYLGYWIEGAPKMGYKARFRPLQALGHGGWRDLEEVSSPAADPAGRSRSPGPATSGPAPPSG